MSHNCALVSHASLISPPLPITLLDAICAQFPLRNLHWKRDTGGVRTIQELNVLLVGLNTKDAEGGHSQIPETVLSKPLVNVYIIVCEDADIEFYRTTIKKPLKEWHTSVTNNKLKQEWLILHVVPPDGKAPAGNFFNRSSVIDKIRSDLNAEKRDRCVQVVWSSLQPHNPPAWVEFVNKLKEGILSAFESAIYIKEIDVKRSESQRQMPGWNFCTFFILKESLATSFEGLHLYVDALEQYDELEVLFHHVLPPSQQTKTLSWFGSFISISPKDKSDSQPLLDPTKKPYRDLILSNAISVFDFRMYLLARQCAILMQMELSGIEKVCRRTIAFLVALGQKLKEQDDLPQLWVESWTYSSALSVVEQCDKWVLAHKLEKDKMMTFNAGKGELLQLARIQLDIIGVEIGYLPSKPPFTTEPSPMGNKQDSYDITNPSLLSAIASSETFYDLYQQLTNRSIDLYAKASRRKYALRLHESLAALDVHRGRLSNALTTYTSLPAHYVTHSWTSLEMLMLSRALDVHHDMGKTKDVEWMHVMLNFLKDYVEGGEDDMLMHADDKVAYLRSLVEAMKETASILEADLVYTDHPAVKITISPKARSAGDRDGSYVNITVENRLPCDLPVDALYVTLRGRHSERMRYGTSTITLLPVGQSKHSLFCPSPASGTYVFESAEVRLVRLLLQWVYNPANANPRTRSHQELKNITLVNVPHDPRALDVMLQHPNQIELGKPPAIVVLISTGRNVVHTSDLKISAPSLTYHLKDARFQTDDIDNIKMVTASNMETLHITDIPMNYLIPVLIPHSDATTMVSAKVCIELAYRTLDAPTLLRTRKVTKTVDTVLPISVNVEDFFRGKRLFSRFTVSTNTHQHVRVLDASLSLPVDAENEGLKVVGCMKTNRGVLTVTPAQPANFLFYVDSINGPVKEPLTLIIKYRRLREDVESHLDSVLSACLDTKTTMAERSLIYSKVVEALETTSEWVDLYEVGGRLVIPKSVEAEGIDIVRKHMESIKNDSAHGAWHEIRIPVDIPNMNIVASARIKIVLPSSQALYAGQPIPAELHIKTSFHWSNADGQRSVLQFDIEELVRDWLVSGQKRGDFVARTNEIYRIPITLIALHHGELGLPKVKVEVKGGGGFMETHQVHGAEKIMVLPRGGRSTFLIGMGDA